jgi:hypothetical protein
MNYFFLGLIMFQALSFKETQLGHSRVKTAYEQKQEIVQSYFRDKTEIKTLTSKTSGYLSGRLRMKKFLKSG